MDDKELRRILSADYQNRVTDKAIECAARIATLDDPTPEKVTRVIYDACYGKGLEILHLYTSANLTHNDLQGSDAAAAAERNFYHAVTGSITFETDEIYECIMNFSDSTDWYEYQDPN